MNITGSSSHTMCGFACLTHSLGFYVAIIGSWLIHAENLFAEKKKLFFFLEFILSMPSVLLLHLDPDTAVVDVKVLSHTPTRNSTQQHEAEMPSADILPMQSISIHLNNDLAMQRPLHFEQCTLFA